MKPFSVEMACLLGIQNEIQAVWSESLHTYFWFHLEWKIEYWQAPKVPKGKPEIYYSSCISLKISWGHKLDSIVGASIVGTGLW